MYSTVLYRINFHVLTNRDVDGLNHRGERLPTRASKRLRHYVHRGLIDPCGPVSFTLEMARGPRVIESSPDVWRLGRD